MVARLTEPWDAGSACYLRILGEISPCLTGPEVSRSLQTRNEQVRGSSPLVGFPEVAAKVPPYARCRPQRAYGGTLAATSGKPTRGLEPLTCSLRVCSDLLASGPVRQGEISPNMRR